MGLKYYRHFPWANEPITGMNMRGFGSVQKSCQWPPSVGHFFRSEMFTRELCYGLVKEIGVGLLELGKQVGIELGKVKRFGFGEEVE